MNTITRWNNKSKKFEAVAVDKLDGKVHDIGNSKPTVFMKKPEADALASVEAAKVKK